MTNEERVSMATEYMYEEEYDKGYEILNPVSQDYKLIIYGIICLNKGLYGEAAYHLSVIDEKIERIRQLDQSTQNLYAYSYLCARKALDFENKISDFTDRDGELAVHFDRNNEERDNIIREKLKRIIETNPQINIETCIRNVCIANSVVEREFNYFCLAEMFFGVQMFAAAALAYLHACECNPNDPKYWAYYAQSILRGSRSDANLYAELVPAYIAIQEAVRLEPDEYEWNCQMCNILHRLTTTFPIKNRKLLSKTIDVCEALSQNASQLSTVETLRENLLKLNLLGGNLWNMVDVQVVNEE